jgi:type IV pilus assembly protein PilV
MTSVKCQLGRQQGVTLIEVLVAVLVLALGLLAVAAMQTSALVNSHSAHHYSLATTLAADALDRVRAGDSVAAVNSYYTANSSRYDSLFPGSVTITVATDGNEAVATVDWNEYRVGDEDGGSSETVSLRSRL